MGSSNLTGAGLGRKEEAGNYELNVRLEEYSDVKFATDEFEEIWNKSVELSAESISNLMSKSCLAEISPYHLYMKFLMEYFGPDFDEDRSRDWPKHKKLAYQVDAVNEALQKLEKHNGLFLADVVGLGKTVIASAVAQALRHQHAHDYSILVVSPPALQEHWEKTLKEFLSVHIDYKTPGTLEDVSGDASRYDLIIVDESHRFRNKGTEQYERLQEICKARTTTGRKKKVLLISATPLNNRPDDLHNQISLFLDGDDCSLTDQPLAQYFKDIRKEHGNIQRLSNRKQAQEQTQQLYGRVRSRVIEKIAIRRTRADLKENKRYANDLARRGVSFPSAKLEPICYELPKNLEKLYDKTIDIISGRGKGPKLQYIRYQVRDLAHKQTGIRQGPEGRSKQLVHLMKVLLLKRMDSSFYAFKETLGRFIKSSQAMLKMIEKGWVIVPEDAKEHKLVLEEKADEILAVLDEGDRESRRIGIEDLPIGFEQGVRSDLNILLKLEAEWSSALEGGDPKFETFASSLDRMLGIKANPEQKLVVFTESADTKEHLSVKLAKLSYNCMAVDSNNAARMLSAIQGNFDANLSPARQKDDCHILITTDVLAEGVNLHRANAVVNYDTPWNVIRLMQRIGRINRIGTKAKTVTAYNFLPTPRMSPDLTLEKRALVKAQAFHSALGADSQIYSDEEEVLSFRIFENNLDEDRSKELSFREELRAFKENNQKEYEHIKDMGLKLRNGVANNKLKKQTFIFARTADRTTSSFYLVGPKAGELQHLDFIESAKLLRCERSRKTAPLHEQHYPQVALAKKEFQQKQQQEMHDSRMQSTSLLSPRMRSAVKDLKALISYPETTNEQKELFKKAIELVLRESRHRFNRELGEFIGKPGSLSFSPKRVAEIANFILESLPDEMPQRDAKEADISPTVVIAQSYK